MKHVVKFNQLLCFTIVFWKKYWDPDQGDLVSSYDGFIVSGQCMKLSNIH